MRVFRRLWVRLFAVIMLCVLLLLGVNWLLNSFVLPGYYRHAKESALKAAFEQVDALYAGEVADRRAALRAIGEESTVSITVWDGDRVVFQDRPDDFREPLMLPHGDLPAQGEYRIRRGEMKKAEYIHLIGRLNNGYWVSMQVPLAAIEESVAISNTFLFYTALAALMVAAVVALLVARAFTRPVQRLSAQAAAVARLDFSHRTAVKGAVELETLGENLNTMSDALAQAIGELREENQRQQRQNEARRAFIANVSHELKTPVALVQTYAEGIREGVAATPDEQAAYCEVIEDEARKMAGLIQKMTALMQLEDGSEPLEREDFDVCELLCNLLSKYEPECERRELTVERPRGQVLVNADAYLMENVFGNLFSNALHHVPNGGRIALSVTPAEGERVRVSVFNSGSTVPPEELPRVWESFYKVDKARTRAYGGSGIGLSLVAAIMKAHGMPYGVQLHGELTDSPAAGVEFFVELPMAGAETRESL